MQGNRVETNAAIYMQSCKLWPDFTQGMEPYVALWCLLVLHLFINMQGIESHMSYALRPLTEFMSRPHSNLILQIRISMLQEGSCATSHMLTDRLVPAEAWH